MRRKKSRLAGRFQQSEYWCVPACIQMVEARHGRFIAQRLIARRLGVKAEGVTFPRAGEYLTRAGYRIRLAERIDWRESRRLLRVGSSVILSVRCSILWRNGEFGRHAVHLISVGPKNCLIFDPYREHGGWRRVSRRRLRLAMSHGCYQALIVARGAD